MEWIDKAFAQLTTEELYEILRVRSAVFVVEQNCPYQDVDGLDLASRHLFIREDGEIRAYLRLFPKSGDCMQIGRVLTTERGKGYGGAILRAGVQAAKAQLTEGRIYLEAQTYAIDFYKKEGFAVTSEEFLEDGIPHVKMELVIP